MTRKEEIINYAKSYQGKGIESEELKDIIKLAIIDGALWADAHPKWKPSNEQMEALSKLEEMHVLEHEKNQENAHLYMVIKSIKEQLWKLKKE